MTPRALILSLLLALTTGPAFAAGPAKEEDAEAEKEAAAAARLPNSMRQHGVIGHVPPLAGMPLFDPSILARMRERLILLSHDTDK